MKNFAGQPEGGGNITILTAQDLIFDVNPNPPIFQKRPIFVDNCKNCNNMENFVDFEGNDEPTFRNGSGFFGDFKINDLIKLAPVVIDTATAKKKREAAERQAQVALEIEQQRLEQERARAEAEAARAAAEASKSGSAASKIKAYVLPIAITGVLVIGGIAAYFYFKKKKIN